MDQVTSLSRPRAGRPTKEQAEARHTELLDSALDHFLDRGFEQATIEAWQAAAMVKKAEAGAGIAAQHVEIARAGVAKAQEQVNAVKAQIEAKKARNLAVASQKRLKDAPDVPTFAEKGYVFYWEQMRGVVGPANMAPEAVKWWQDTLRKVVATPKWQNDYIKRNLLTPTDWTGDQANKYLDSLREKYAKALQGLKAAQK